MSIILPTNDDIQKYEMLIKLLRAQKGEYLKLSAKKPLDQLNPIKIEILNKVIIPLKELMKNEETYSFLPELNEEKIPNNSDVVIILSQYMTAIENFRTKYYIKDKQQSDHSHSVYRWNTKENPIK